MELENAVATLNVSDTFFKVNVEPHKDLRNALGIPPIIKIYRKGISYDYKGPKVTKGNSYVNLKSISGSKIKFFISRYGKLFPKGDIASIPPFIVFKRS